MNVRIACLAVVAITLGFLPDAMGHSEPGGRAPARAGRDSPRMASKAMEPANKPKKSPPILGRLLCIDPDPSKNVASGESVQITFEPHNQINVNRVLFVSTVDTSLITTPPWSTTIDIPIDFTGTVKCVASVFQDSGNSRQGKSTELILFAEAPAPLVGIEINHEVLWVFDFVPDKYCSYDVVGIYADGIKRVLNPDDFPMKAELDNTDVAKVDTLRRPKSKAVRIVKGVKHGTAKLTVTHDQFTARADVVYNQ